MSRKSLILCLSAMAVLLLGLGVAIAVLYSGTGRGDSCRRQTVSYDGSRSCFAAIPSDAVLVSCFDRAGSACKGLLSGFSFPAALSAGIEDGTLESLKKSHLAVSLHYSGKLAALYVLDLKHATEAAVTALHALCDGTGMHYASHGEMMMLSESETLVKSAVRHMEKSVSISDAPGFDAAADAVDGDDMLLISNLHVQKLMSSVFAPAVSRKSSFVERVSDWMAFDIDCSQYCPVSFHGSLLYDSDADEFLTVLEDCEPSVSGIADVLPSYTLFAVSLPVRNMESYMSSYQSFVDSRQGLQTFKSVQKGLAGSVGMMPDDFFRQLEVKEIGNAAFVAGGKLEHVNLIHAGSRDAALISGNKDIKSLKNLSSAVYAWAYPSFVSSVFGKQFALADESCFTYVDGWIITGSRSAVEEYVGRNALDYTLGEYMADAGLAHRLSERPALAVSYFSFTEKKDGLDSWFRKDMLGHLLSRIDGCDYAPAVMFLEKDKSGMSLSFDMHCTSLQKTQAPAYDRDTEVTVPQGPFKVKNSGTGKMNLFYQNSQKAICLRDETGRDLWGVPFGKSLCGTAHNVDYYANGKLQIIFGAESSIYVIDRLGRYVTGFPMDLGRKIVLGPDVYDFSGARRYNIMVLHDDNSVQMYNLKGKKPESWKGITAEETIKALPERLVLGGSDFWVVRTSIQTLIFPFYGGEPLTKLDGDSRIRPDSEVRQLEGHSVQVSCYDGKVRNIRLK